MSLVYGMPNHHANADFPGRNLAPSGHSEKMIPSVLATVSANSLALSGGISSTLMFPMTPSTE